MRKSTAEKIKYVKMLLPVMLIIVVLLLAGYTYSWFVASSEAPVEAIVLRSASAISMAFTVDGENQTGPVEGETVRRFNGQKGVDEDNLWIDDNEVDDRVYIASYPLTFFIQDTKNLGLTNAQLVISFFQVKVLKYQGQSVVINETLTPQSDIVPNDRFTWEIVWNGDVYGPYGKITQPFNIGNTQLQSIELPYRTDIECTFNIIYMGQETYWDENYRATPTTTEYDPCHYSDDMYKGCQFEFIVTCEVLGE